jgi:hypothetical protein
LIDLSHIINVFKPYFDVFKPYFDVFKPYNWWVLGHKVGFKDIKYGFRDKVIALNIEMMVI